MDTAGDCYIGCLVLTHYRKREVRNSIYPYKKIHIDYRSKFSYRFISSISIIYGNTNYNIYIYTIIYHRIMDIHNVVMDDHDAIIRRPSEFQRRKFLKRLNFTE